MAALVVGLAEAVAGPAKAAGAGASPLWAVRGTEELAELAELTTWDLSRIRHPVAALIVGLAEAVAGPAKAAEAWPLWAARGTAELSELTAEDLSANAASCQMST